MTTPLLVATHGEDGALGALRMARHLAERDGSPVRVLAVLGLQDATSMESPEYFPRPASMRDEMSRLRRRVLAQLEAVGAGALDWPVRVEAGPVVRTVARVAEEESAGMVLLGLGGSAPLERWLDRRLLVKVARRARIPVLAVPAMAMELPRQAVLAFDFSEDSHRAGRELVDRVGHGAMLHVVHVLPALYSGDLLVGRAEWEKLDPDHAAAELSALSRELEASHRVTVRIHIRSGEIAEEILKAAAEVGAEVIATGSHGRGLLGRALLGSVSEKLLRSAVAAVLVVPSPAPAGEETVAEGAAAAPQMAR